MGQIKKVKMAIKLGLSSIMETFWAIGTSAVAGDVLLKKHENTTIYKRNAGFSDYYNSSASFQHRQIFDLTS